MHAIIQPNLLKTKHLYTVYENSLDESHLYMIIKGDLDGCTETACFYLVSVVS